jgi:hypothetical protein
MVYINYILDTIGIIILSTIYIEPILLDSLKEYIDIFLEKKVGILLDYI